MRHNPLPEDALAPARPTCSAGTIVLVAVALSAAGICRSAWAEEPKQAIVSPQPQKTEIATLAASLKPGQWGELKTHNMVPTLRAKGASGAIFGYNEDAVWSPSSRQVLYLGGDHGDPARFVAYSADTNSWKTLAQPAWLGRGGTLHGYSHHALDPAKGIFYYFPYGDGPRPLHRYDVASGKWSTLPELKEAEYLACCVGVEYFPELGGVVVANGGGGKGSVHLFKTSEQKWVTLARDLPMGKYHNTAQYSPVHKAVVFGGGNDSSDVYKLDSAGKVTTQKKAPLGLGINQSILTVDPASGDFLVFGRDASFYVYDVKADTWQRQKNKPPIFEPGRVTDCKVWHVTATPVSSYGVTMFIKYLHADPPKAWVYLYRHSD